MKETVTKETLKKTKQTTSKEKKEKKVKIDISEQEKKDFVKIDDEIKGDVVPNPEEDFIKKDGVNYKNIVAKGEYFVINGERFREAIDAAKYNYKINGDK